MGVNSRRKGSTNERELCKLMESWTGYEFARVPASGGLRWKNTQDTVGDIICTDKFHSRRFRLTIETKFYKDINFEHLILGNKKVKINEFWNQAKDDGIRANKVPIVLMRYNGMPKQTYFVIISQKLFNLLPKMDFEYDYFTIHQKTEKLIVMNSNDLIKADYKTLHKQLKKLIKNG